MKPARFGIFRGIVTLSLSLAGLLAVSCIFSPPSTKGLAYPSVQTIPYDSVTTATADRIVDLFEPYLDQSLGTNGQSALAQAFPTRVREHGTGRVVEYRHSQRGYGSWNADRERELHLFLLRAFFFHPGTFDDSAGTGDIDSLYARAHDAHTRRIDSADAEEYRRLSRTTVRPRVLGIQIRVNDAGDTVFLDLVAPGSPADKAKLRRGMPILAVNGNIITGDSALARFIRFVEADTVATTLTVGTASGPRAETIVRDTASFPTVQADSLGGAGYIAIHSFTQSTVGGGSTYDEFRKALDATRRFPATVLDLRGNGGGSLPVVLRMCDEVLSGGVIIRLIERDLRNGASLRTESAYRANPGEKGEGRSFVLLADEGSASASEIFIAALRENLNSPFVGARTYGKGVGQAAFDTPGGGVAIVTYGSARTASGADYNGVGLQPTHASTAKPDAMLAEAVNVAVPGGLARRGTDGSIEAGARAAAIDWNRRQAVRPDIQEWGDAVEWRGFADPRGKEER